MLRVLKLATNNPLVWQKALLTKEVRARGGLNSIVSLAPSAVNACSCRLLRIELASGCWLLDL